MKEMKMRFISRERETGLMELEKNKIDKPLTYISFQIQSTKLQFQFTEQVVPGKT